MKMNGRMKKIIAALILAVCSISLVYGLYCVNYTETRSREVPYEEHEVIATYSEPTQIDQTYRIDPHKTKSVPITVVHAYYYGETLIEDAMITGSFRVEDYKGNIQFYVIDEATYQRLQENPYSSFIPILMFERILACDPFETPMLWSAGTYYICMYNLNDFTVWVHITAHVWWRKWGPVTKYKTEYYEVKPLQTPGILLLVTSVFLGVTSVLIWRHKNRNEKQLVVHSHTP